MKTILFHLMISIFLVFIISYSSPLDSIRQSPEAHNKFDPYHNAAKDIKDAIVTAKKLNKRILLDIGGDWCIWCHRLDSLFIQNKDLEDYLFKHYVVVKINVSKENYNEEVLSKYPKVAGYPHLFVLNKNGKLLHSQDTGELEYPKNNSIKGHDKKKVFAFLKKWTR